MTTPIVTVTGDALMALADERRDPVRDFIDWADRHEHQSWSMYLANRPDIEDARQAAALYPDPWWGVVVFTCFGSLKSARAVRNVLSTPAPIELAEEVLPSIEFSRPMVGHHRIQQGLLGAKKASSLPAGAKSSFMSFSTRPEVTTSVTSACGQRALHDGEERPASTCCCVRELLASAASTTSLSLPI